MEGLERRLRTDSASPHYGLLDRVTAYMAKTSPDSDERLVTVVTPAGGLTQTIPREQLCQCNRYCSHKQQQ
jgi:hypothetical protein